MSAKVGQNCHKMKTKVAFCLWWKYEWQFRMHLIKFCIDFIDILEIWVHWQMKNEDGKVFSFLGWQNYI